MIEDEWTSNMVAALVHEPRKQLQTVSEGSIRAATEAGREWVVNDLRRWQRRLGRDGKADWYRQVNGIERWSCLHHDLIAVKEPDGVLDPHDIKGGFQRRRPAKPDLGSVTTHQSPSDSTRVSALAGSGRPVEATRDHYPLSHPPHCSDTVFVGPPPVAAIGPKAAVVGDTWQDIGALAERWRGPSANSGEYDLPHTSVCPAGGGRPDPSPWSAATTVRTMPAATSWG
jgi:hypothetical protein